MGFSKVIHCSLSEGNSMCSAGMQCAWSDLQTRSTVQCWCHPGFVSPAHIRKQSSFIAWHCIQPNKPSQEPEFTNQLQGLLHTATLLPSQGGTATEQCLYIQLSTAGYPGIMHRAMQALWYLHSEILHSLHMLHKTVAPFPRTCQVSGRGQKVLHSCWFDTLVSDPCTSVDRYGQVFFPYNSAASKLCIGEILFYG